MGVGASVAGPMGSAAGAVVAGVSGPVAALCGAAYGGFSGAIGGQHGAEGGVIGGVVAGSAGFIGPVIIGANLAGPIGAIGGAVVAGVAGPKCALHGANVGFAIGARSSDCIRRRIELANQDPMLTSEPADQNHIEALPTHSITASEVAVASEEHQHCTICIEAFHEGDELRILPCLHRYHRACIDTWLHRNGTCPICKHRVDADETTLLL